MLTAEEEKFVEYWKNNREKEKKTFRQLVIGLPIGLSFAIAVLAIFSSGWYERANMVAYSSSSPYIFVTAIIVIIGFIAIFSKKHRWDMNEQRYLELVHKRNNPVAKAAEDTIKQSPAKPDK
jgi:membrane protein YdbS with pleckstrin-like domain